MNGTENLKRLWPQIDVVSVVNQTDTHTRYLVVNHANNNMNLLLDILYIPAVKSTYGGTVMGSKDGGTTVLTGYSGVSGSEGSSLAGVGEPNAALAECISQIEQIQRLSESPESGLLRLLEYKVITDQITGDTSIYVFLEGLQSVTMITAQGNIFSTSEVRTLGLDCCTGMETMVNSGIYRDDILPEEIFYAGGRFRLGNYKYTSQISSAIGVAGTGGREALYHSPEKLRRQYTDIRSELYSLAMVMYELSNQNRLPFAVKPSSELSFMDIENMLSRRMADNTLVKAPSQGDATLREAIMRGISPMAIRRFSSAAEMRNALISAPSQAQPAVMPQSAGFVPKQPDERGTGALLPREEGETVLLTQDREEEGTVLLTQNREEEEGTVLTTQDREEEGTVLLTQDREEEEGTVLLTQNKEEEEGTILLQESSSPSAFIETPVPEAKQVNQPVYSQSAPDQAMSGQTASGPAASYISQTGTLDRESAGRKEVPPAGGNVPPASGSGNGKGSSKAVPILIVLCLLMSAVSFFVATTMVSKNYEKKEQELLAAQEAEAAAREAAAQEEAQEKQNFFDTVTYFVDVYSQLELRQKPYITAPVSEYLPKETKLKIIGDGWGPMVEVETEDGKWGYVEKQFLTAEGVKPLRVGRMIPGELTEGTIYVVDSYDSIELLTGWDFNYAVRSYIPAGASVQVLEWTDTFAQIVDLRSGDVGYVNITEGQIAKWENLAIFGTGLAQPTAGYFASASYPVNASTTVSLLEAPTEYSKAVYTLHPGQWVTLEELSADEAFCLITVQDGSGTKGYVPIGLLYADSLDG